MASVAELSRLYDTSTLEYWGGRYRHSTTKILDEVIWPALSSAEQRGLSNRKPILDFSPDVFPNPLHFYAVPDRHLIGLPVFSLKFLDDLCTAYAWLHVQGFSLETVSEYTAVLKYRRLPSGSLPPPLKALRIPENALADSQVDELALGHFVTARTFLLLHELGHLLHRHRPSTLAESVANERQADHFAATVMQRTPLPPLGMLVFFMADAHWSRFPAGGGDTHPLSGERVSALADHLGDRKLAEQLRKLGRFLDDPDIRSGFVATGRAGDLAALAPRRPGELPRRVPLHRKSEEVLFDGVYQGEFVQFLEPDPMAIELVLKRQGDSVTGGFSFGLGFGTFEGKVVGSQLVFEWKWLDNSGFGVLEGHEDGSFAGTWGYLMAKSGAGTWTGRRRP